MIKVMIIGFFMSICFTIRRVYKLNNIRSRCKSVEELLNLDKDGDYNILFMDEEYYISKCHFIIKLLSKYADGNLLLVMLSSDGDKGILSSKYGVYEIPILINNKTKIVIPFKNNNGGTK